MVNKIRLRLIHVIRLKTKKWEFPFGKLIFALFAVFILNSFRVFGPNPVQIGSNEPESGASSNVRVDLPIEWQTPTQEIASNNFEARP